MCFSKNWPTLRQLCSVQLTSTDKDLRRVQPAAKKAKLKAVCFFLYDSDEIVDLRGIEVTLIE